MMVNEIEHKGKTYYQCEICKFYYKKKELATQCEEFCRKHKSCSLKLTKYAIKIK